MATNNTLFALGARIFFLVFLLPILMNKFVSFVYGITDAYDNTAEMYTIGAILFGIVFSIVCIQKFRTDSK